MNQQLATDRLGRLPTDLSSPRSKLVYLYLETSGGATVADLNEALGMQKITILSVLDTLSSRDLVAREDGAYVALE